MDNIFQIFLCKEKYREENLRDHAEFFNTARQNMLAVYPDYQYNLYTNVEAARFVKAFSPEVHRAYWSLAPFAYRADLLRLCLLYEYGGWYFDLPARPLFRFDLDKDCLFERDEHTHNSRFFENFVLYAKPKSKFLEVCIDKIVDNIHNKKYVGSLRISGPLLLAEVLEQNVYLQSTMSIYSYQAAREAIVVNDTVFAIHKTGQLGFQQPGIDYLGFKGVNVYHDLYESKLAYITPWNMHLLCHVTDTQEIVYA